MPYIPIDERPVVTQQTIGHAYLTDPGQLTYAIFKLAVNALQASSHAYADRSRVRASLQDAVDEFYRRHMAPYEDNKMNDNGDVF